MSWGADTPARGYYPHEFLNCTLLHLGAHRSSQASTQALMAFHRSLSVLLMLPVWQGMEAMSSK